MVIQGGRYETALQVLSVSGTIRDAASLNVDGGSTIRDTGTVSNIDTVIFTNIYNHHINNGVQGNLSSSLTNEGIGMDLENSKCAPFAFYVVSPKIKARTLREPLFGNLFKS